MVRNWNDRADKDLCFAIISVKRVENISGAEWEAIGEHMRLQGYTFTNEGCRQHYQAYARVRRSKGKPDETTSNLELKSKGDPALNPVKRRPRRGRPSKTATVAVADNNHQQHVETVTNETEAQTSVPLAVTPPPTQTPDQNFIVEEARELHLEEHPAKRRRLDVEEQVSEMNAEPQQDIETNHELVDNEWVKVEHRDAEHAENPNNNEAVTAPATNGVTEFTQSPE
ncbi:hypothetical protein F4808DRAFT_420656 [Astrocystis sublimbata]|nr:hypothetical protein F4808DRAFT_420656 [Astrocystis sublimbata]